MRKGTVKEQDLKYKAELKRLQTCNSQEFFYLVLWVFQFFAFFFNSSPQNYFYIKIYIKGLDQERKERKGKEGRKEDRHFFHNCQTLQYLTCKWGGAWSAIAMESSGNSDS